MARVEISSHVVLYSSSFAITRPFSSLRICKIHSHADIVVLESGGNPRMVKVTAKLLYLTSVVPSVTRLVSMEADAAHFTPLPLSVLCFTGI